MPCHAAKAAAAATGRLSKLQGREFDKAFVEELVKDHEKTVKFYEKQTKDGKSDAVQDFVEQTLPTLKTHLQEAKELQTRLQGKG